MYLKLLKNFDFRYIDFPDTIFQVTLNPGGFLASLLVVMKCSLPLVIAISNTFHGDVQIVIYRSLIYMHKKHLYI